MLSQLLPEVEKSLETGQDSLNDANYMVVLGGGSQTNSDGCSVTGGYVYRGKKIRALNGYYIFGDFPDNWTFLGLFIIVLSGIYITKRESLVRKLK